MPRKIFWPPFLLLILPCAGIWLALREPMQSPADYHLIEEGLYLGSAVAEPPPKTSAVVNLCSREDPYKVEFMRWDPILEGGKAPDLEWLKGVVAFIDAQRRARRTVYVHCMAGVNRSATVVTAYLMAEHGWDRDTALAHVRSRRPVAQPDPGLLQLLADWKPVSPR